MAITEIKNAKDDALQDTRSLLNEAIDMGFVSVTIVGEMGNGLVHIKSSSTESVQKKLGALEITKHELLKDWS